MLEAQPDWPLLDSFYVRCGDAKYQFTRKSDTISCSDPAVEVQAFGRSFRATFPGHGPCTFIAPKSTLEIHSGAAVNCIDVTQDGTEVLSGDASGRLRLTHLGTEPVPLPGPTPDFGVEDCLIDNAHKLFFACGGDFRIYEFSATEYQFTGRYDGHKSSVTRVDVRGDVLFSGSRDRVIARWDIEQRKRVSSSTMGGPVNDFCFAECGSIFAACDNSVLAIDERTGQGAVSPGCPSGPIFNCVTSEGNNLVAGLSDGVVLHWDVRNMQEPTVSWSWYDAPVHGVVYKGGKLWCMTDDGTAACVDIGEKKALTVLGTRAYAPVLDMAFKGDVSLWTADGEGVMSLFEL